MPTIIIIEKTGELNEKIIKNTILNEDTLYKKIGLKTNNNFEPLYKNDNYVLYGKKTGKSNQLNNFNFKPFNINTHIYGTCILLLLNNGIIENLTIEQLNNYIMITSPPITTSPPPIIIEKIPKQPKKGKTSKLTESHHINIFEEPSQPITNEIYNGELQEEEYI